MTSSSSGPSIWRQVVQWDVVDPQIYRHNKFDNVRCETARVNELLTYLKYVLSALSLMYYAARPPRSCEAMYICKMDIYRRPWAWLMIDHDNIELFYRHRDYRLTVASYSRRTWMISDWWRKCMQNFELYSNYDCLCDCL